MRIAMQRTNNKRPAGKTKPTSTNSRTRSEDRRPARPRTDDRTRSEDRRPARPRTDDRTRSEDRRPARPRTDDRTRSDDRRPTRPRTEGRSAARRKTDSQRPSRPYYSRSPATLPTQDVRLNRAIADAGVASRRRADELIREGQVTVNGKVCTELGLKIGTSDIVAVNGEPITRYKHLTYVLLNKPKDIITTANDEFGRATVFDIVRLKTRLFTVGRLDRNTTGVLLLTNDGELCNRLMHPRYGIPRVYNATLDKPIEARHAAAIAAGVELEDGPSQPCEVFIDPRDPHKVSVQIKEGRNREVRRLFESVGYDVRKLDRKQYAFLTTRGLPRGVYRHLTRDEVFELQRLVNLGPSASLGGRKGKRS